MSFIGIITNPKNKEYMLKRLSNHFHVIFITDKNIEEVKDTKFETIIIDTNMKDIRNLKIVVANTKYIILNSDLVIDFDILENLNLMVISYGFNNKATFSVSSVTENNIIICLQRIIKDIFSEIYEPQEFEMKMDENIDIYAIISVCIILIFYQKIQILVK